MKLVRVKIRNFRCYSTERSFELSDFTCLIGQNDAGKSAFLEALDIFFNDAKPDIGDKCINCDSTELNISCTFSDLPDSIVIDDTASTTLDSEFLLQEDDLLEISRRFTYDIQNQAVRSSGFFVECKYPVSDRFSDLHGITIAQLRKLAKDISSNIEDIDKRKSSELRRAIWKASEPLELEHRSVSLEKDRKDHWKQLKLHLPVFSLFKSDRANNNSDSEIQDPLKAAIKEATKQVEAQIEAIKKLVTSQLDEIATATLEKVRELDESLAQELRAKIEAKDSSSLFSAYIHSDGGIPIDKRGTGVRRLILLSFFRANLESRIKERNASSVIYALEEPETGQHPEHQKMILRHLQELAISQSSQVIITTHSPAIARNIDSRSIIFLRKNKSDSPTISDENTEEVHKDIITDLGIFPAHGVKLFLALEGANDINFFRNLSSSLADEGVEGVVSFDELERSNSLMIMPQGGSNLAFSSSKLYQLSIPEYHIFDRDNPPDKDPKYHNEAIQVVSRGGQAFHLNRKELENYIPPQAIVEAYANNNITIVLENDFEPFEDVPLKIAQLIHAENSDKDWDSLKEDRKKEKVKNAKGFIGNWVIPSRDSLKAVDEDEEILNHIKQICSICSS